MWANERVRAFVCCIRVCGADHVLVSDHPITGRLVCVNERVRAFVCTMYMCVLE